MLAKDVKRICIDQKGYGTPSLNEKLFLHHKGFLEIGECLREYTEVRVLWLHRNCISKIENLENCTQLRSLFLHENGICKVEGLDNLQNLDKLNLASNPLKKLENMENLQNLTTLIVEKCFFNTVENIREIVKLKKLNVLNISQNNIEEPEILDVLKELPELKVLYLKGNPCVKSIRSYRKKVVSSIPTLTYLDDRPIFETERRLADAWAKGGHNAEKEERKRIKEEKDASDKRYHEKFKEFSENAKKSLGNTEEENEESLEEDLPSTPNEGNKREKLEVGVIEEAGQEKKVFMKIKTKPLIEELDYGDMDMVDPDMPSLEPIHGLHNVKVE